MISVMHFDLDSSRLNISTINSSFDHNGFDVYYDNSELKDLVWRNNDWDLQIPK